MSHDLEKTERRHGLASSLLLAGIVLVAIALRFWRLGDWSLDSDETFTLRDSLRLRPTNPRPLLYLLNHYVVSPLMPLDELGLRILPAAFGVLAIPVFYFVGRRLVGTRAALFGALLLAFSGLQVYYSQFARYWSLVFLLSAVYPYAIYLGLRDHDRRTLALGLVTAGLAALAHPVSLLLAGGIGLWVVASYLRISRFRQLWNQRGFRWGALLGVILLVALAARFIPMLQSWIYEHDTKKTSTEFLYHLPGRPGVKQLAYLLSFVESLTLPLVLCAVLGIYLLLRGRDRSLGILLAGCLAVPVILLVLLSFRTPVSTFYLVPTTPIFFLGAGVLLDRLAELDWELRPRWLLSATLATFIIAAGAPTLVSQYRDGRRYDFRGVALWLSERIGPGDIVFSDQSKVLAHYLPGTKVYHLRGDPAALMRSMRFLHASDRQGVLWVVSPAPSHAFRTNPKLGNLHGWMFDNCQLRITIGVGRVDFRQYHLQVYRCPAGVPREEAVQARSRGAPTSP
jgi:mannosyltransferase